MIKGKHFFKFISFILLSFTLSATLYAQIELEPWGNISGIRIEGELMQIQSSLAVISSDGSHIRFTGKEKQRPVYERKGNKQIVHTNIDSLYFSETVEDIGEGKAAVTIKVRSTLDQDLSGAYFSVFLPDNIYGTGSLRADNTAPVKFTATQLALENIFKKSLTTLRFISLKRQITMVFKLPVQPLIKRQQDKNEKGLHLYIPLLKGSLIKGDTVSNKFIIKASGTVNKTPVQLSLQTSALGKKFVGLGGNFRLQNSRTDPQVIDYCLENLNIRWSRVEMPWQLWQPEMEQDPIATAQSGKLNQHVRKSMEMAQRLYKKGIPVILSAWSAPAWAVVGKPKYGPDTEGVWGNALDSTRTAEIYKSIADYIIYLKNVYGVNISLFSFNESDLGINIRQTGEEHARLIKGLGAYFVSRGLPTKLLLGDNSDATTYAFLDPALNNPATYPFIGAVSFHSWRGWDGPTLEKWSAAATRLRVPLIVGEGSIDAQAWGYPAIFEEPSYALQEINLYTRILAICQPESILQWQLTADYSPLSGGGIFGDTSPLRPTQRFWNLKQLSSTPEGLRFMTIESEGADISVAALGDLAKNSFAFHLVNNGATREAILKGLPKTLTTLQMYITDRHSDMKKGKLIPVKNGETRFNLPQTSYVSLFSE